MGCNLSVQLDGTLIATILFSLRRSITHFLLFDLEIHPLLQEQDKQGPVSVPLFLKKQREK